MYVDIGDSTGRAVEITTDGWRIVQRSPVKFIRPAGMKPLPEPGQGGNLRDLQDLLSLGESDWVRVLAFIINCYRPTGPYMPLLISADQGSGKSVLSDIIKRIVDPNEISKISLPRSEHELMIQASQHALLVFDNISYLRAGMSDLFCRLATGGGMIVRRLYEDRDVVVFNEYRAFLLNGIGSFAERPDLMERAIHLPLKAIPDDVRRTEKELYAAFESMLPAILGSLFDIVAFALREVDKTATPTTIRMADTAQWLAAAERATDLDPGSFITALEEGQE